VIRSRHSGRIQYIKLRSCGDDHGHSAEQHGNSGVSTRRITNDAGMIIAPRFMLEHKPLPRPQVAGLPGV
jgi:hypothetical protein